MGYTNGYGIKNIIRLILSIIILVFISAATIYVIPVILTIAAVAGAIGLGAWGIKKMSVYLKEKFQGVKSNVNYRVNSFSTTTSDYKTEIVEIDQSANGTIIDVEFEEEN